MKLEVPKPKLREDSDYGVIVGKGYGDPRGTISFDEAWELTLDDVRPEDCDRLIRAAAEVKERVLAYRAELAVPHGTKHLYKGRCQLCGKPEADELHAEAAAARLCAKGGHMVGVYCKLPPHGEGDHLGAGPDGDVTWPPETVCDCMADAPAGDEPKPLVISDSTIAQAEFFAQPGNTVDDALAAQAVAE